MKFGSLSNEITHMHLEIISKYTTVILLPHTHSWTLSGAITAFRRVGWWRCCSRPAASPRPAWPPRQPAAGRSLASRAWGSLPASCKRQVFKLGWSGIDWWGRVREVPGPGAWPPEPHQQPWHLLAPSRSTCFHPTANARPALPEQRSSRFGK